MTTMTTTLTTTTSQISCFGGSILPPPMACKFSSPWRFGQLLYDIVRPDPPVPIPSSRTSPRRRPHSPYGTDVCVCVHRYDELFTARLDTREGPGVFGAVPRGGDWNAVVVVVVVVVVAASVAADGASWRSALRGSASERGLHTTDGSRHVERIRRRSLGVHVHVPPAQGCAPGPVGPGSAEDGRCVVGRGGEAGAEEQAVYEDDAEADAGTGRGRDAGGSDG